MQELHVDVTGEKKPKDCYYKSYRVTIPGNYIYSTSRADTASNITCRAGQAINAQIIDGCGLSYCTRTRSDTANTSARYTVGL